MRRVVRLIQHALVERQPAQLAVDIERRVATGPAAAARRRGCCLEAPGRSAIRVCHCGLHDAEAGGSVQIIVSDPMRGSRRAPTAEIRKPVLWPSIQDGPATAAVRMTSGGSDPRASRTRPGQVARRASSRTVRPADRRPRETPRAARDQRQTRRARGLDAFARAAHRAGERRTRRNRRARGAAAAITAVVADVAAQLETARDLLRVIALHAGASREVRGAAEHQIESLAMREDARVAKVPEPDVRRDRPAR